MTRLQKLEEEASDDERSIILVDIMHALGFSKSEQGIRINSIDRLNEVFAIYNAFNSVTQKLLGRTGDGLRGGIHSVCDYSDVDIVCTVKNVKLHTSHGNNINNPSLLPLQENEHYDAHFFVEEDDNFPGYVKLQFAGAKFNSDGRLSISNYRMKDFYHRYLRQLWQRHACKYSYLLLTDSGPIPYINGPAVTLPVKYEYGNSFTVDFVLSIHCDAWPNSAHSFLTRCRPHICPSTDMLNYIKSQGYDIVGVGHNDSENDDEQWRISFPGERNLRLDLNDVQILCYALIKIILRENLNTSQRELVSSFHVMHVLFWCVECCSPCQWIYSNYINCLNICLAKLIEGIKAKHISPYIIEKRNMFNSKLTEQKSKAIVDVLSNYDTTHVFRLAAFKHVSMNTQLDNTQLKREALISKLVACFSSYACFLPLYMGNPYLFWNSYIPHNATKSLSSYENILQNLKKVKGVVNQHAKYLTRSMIGFLNYVKYKESNITDCLNTSRRLIHKSLNMDNSCVRLRAATFFFTDQKYIQSIDICNKYCTFPPRHQGDTDFLKYGDIILHKVKKLIKVKTTEEIERILKKIVPLCDDKILQMSDDKWKLEYSPGKYDIAQQNIVWIFHNFINIAFHDICQDVIFMTAEQWVVPDPIKYELLSLPPNADYEGFPLSGIHLDPMFVCNQTQLLCHHSMENVTYMTQMLSLIESNMEKNTFTTKTCYAYLNMFAYCQIKAGHHRQFVKSILQSLRIFPSRYNAASGYLKIVLQILNSLSI